MMDSMTKKELDCEVAISETRLLRICQGSGTNPRDLMFLLGEHKKFSKMVEKMGKLNLDDNAENMKRNPQQTMRQLQ